MKSALGEKIHPQTTYKEVGYPGEPLCTCTKPCRRARWNDIPFYHRCLCMRSWCALPAIRAPSPTVRTAVEKYSVWCVMLISATNVFRYERNPRTQCPLSHYISADAESERLPCLKFPSRISCRSPQTFRDAHRSSHDMDHHSHVRRAGVTLLPQAPPPLSSTRRNAP